MRTRLSLAAAPSQLEITRRLLSRPCKKIVPDRTSQRETCIQNSIPPLLRAGLSFVREYARCLTTLVTDLSSFLF